MVGYEQHIKFLSDNSLVVVECKPGKSVAYLWTAAGELQRTSETMACGPHAVKVALSLDGLVAFLNKKGDKITVWNAVKDTQIEIRDSDPWHMTFSTDGRLATCLTAAPYRINIWSKDGQLLQTMRGENFPSRLAFSSDDISTRLAAMVDGGMVYIYSWNGVEYERTGCFSPRTDYVYSRFGFLDGAYLVFWTMSGLLKVWDCNNFEQIHSIQAGEDGIKHLGISSRGLIATTSYIRERYGSDEYGKIVKIWDSSLFAKGDGQFDYKSKQEARVAISHDGTLVASTLKWKPGKVALRDASTGETTRTLEHHSNVIRSLEFSPDDRYLLSMDYNERQGRFNGLANIYDREADRVRNRHALKIGCKCYLAVSANSRWLAILGLDRNSNTQRIPMEIWDLELEDPTLKWKTQVPLIEPHCCLAFSPSSRLVAFSGVSSPGMFESKCRIIILDVENGEWLPQIRVDENPSAIAFYSKHPWLVWADTKSVITVWDIERRVEVQRVTAGRIDVRQLECIDSEDSEDERFTINSGQVVSEPGKDLVDLAPGSYSYRNSGWLSFNGENVLFFPKQFRPATIRDVNSRDYSLAVCLTSGSVLYFLFSADMNLFS
jgi:WD40 repeat protein